jgi:hypothetical protein
MGYRQGWWRPSNSGTDLLPDIDSRALVLSPPRGKMHVSANHEVLDLPEQDVRPENGRVHILVIVGRVIAGCVSVLAFYMAFFLYEDQEGRWQNRLDGFWVSVHDRARVTQSSTVALFNRIADIVRRALVWLFGEKLFSVRAVCMSICISAGVALLGSGLFVFFGLLHDDPGGFQWLKGLLIVIGVAPCLAAPLLVRKRFAALVLISSTFVLTCAVFFGCLAAIANPTILPLPPMTQIIPTVALILAFSLSSDVLGVIAVRRILSFLTHALSSLRVLLGIFLLAALIVLFEYVPWIALFVFLFDRSLGTEETRSMLAMVAGVTAYLNISTSLYCLIPALLLVVVLVHRAIWPLMAKAIYPLCRFKIVSNRKALIAIGSVSMITAIHPSALNPEKILDYLFK